MNVAFFHPDLGIGGAEKLLVDAAVYIMTHNTGKACNSVGIFTLYYDPKRCFEASSKTPLECQLACN